MALADSAEKLGLSLDNHFSWTDPEKARSLFESGKLSLDDYLAGLFYHPDHTLYLNESERLDAV